MYSTFRDKIYELLRKVPRGKVVTYGQLGELAGYHGAGRAVGMCMRTNPDAPRTPCHRVVAADGKLTGYSAKEGIKTKREMLLEEGVQFIGEKVNLKLSQWQPHPSQV